MGNNVILYKFNVDPKSEELIVTTHKILRQYSAATNYNCKKIFIGKSVEEIDKGFFTYFKHVNSISVDSENEFFVSINNCLINKKTHELIKVGNECNEIPHEVKIISDHAFEGYNNKTINELRIPENIEEIQGDAFKSSKVKKVVIKHEINKVSNNAFRGYNGFYDILDYYFNKVSNKQFKLQFCFQKVTNYFKKPIKPEYKTQYDSFISEFLNEFLTKYSHSIDFINYLSTEWEMDNSYKEICFEISRNFKELSPIIINKIENKKEVPTFDLLSLDNENSLDFNEDNNYIKRYYVFKNDNSSKIKVTNIKDGGAFIFPIMYYGKDVEFVTKDASNRTIILRENYDEKIVRKFINNMYGFIVTLQIDCEYVPISFVIEDNFKKVIFGENFKGFIDDKKNKHNIHCPDKIEVSPLNSNFSTNTSGKYLYDNVKKELILASYNTRPPLDMEYIGDYVESNFLWTTYNHLKILDEKCVTSIQNLKKEIAFPESALEISFACIKFDSYVYNSSRNNHSPKGVYKMKFGEAVSKITPTYNFSITVESIEMNEKNKYFDTCGGTCLIEKETDTLLLSTTKLNEIPEVKTLNLGAFLYGVSELKTYVLPKSIKKINDISTIRRFIYYNIKIVKPSLIVDMSEKKFDKLVSQTRLSNFPFYNGGGNIIDYYIAKSLNEITYILLSNNRIIIRDAVFKSNKFDEILEKLKEHNIELIGLENISAGVECRSLKIPKSVQYISEGEKSDYGYLSCSTLISLEYKEDEVPFQLACCLKKIKSDSYYRHKYNIEYKKS